MMDGNVNAPSVCVDDEVHGTSEVTSTILRKASVRVSRRSPSQGLRRRVVNEKHMQRAVEVSQ